MLLRHLRQLRYLLRRKKSESDLEREIGFHLEMETREHEESGLARGEARRRALADFGSVAACQDMVRDAWGLSLWSDLQRDLRYTLRLLRRRPAYAVLTILTLAVGIGATSAVFSLFDRVVLRPLPYADEDRLVHLWETRPNQEFAQMEASYPNFVDWSRRSQSFDALAGYNRTNFTLTGLGMPARVSATRVSANMLSVLGTSPILGRDFRPEEEALDASHVVLISWSFWQRQFAGRNDTIGKTLTLGGIPYQIVGILPASFRFLLDGSSELLVPLGPSRDQIQRRQFHWVKTIGRLRAGVTLAQASSEMKALAEDLAREYPVTNTGTSVRIIRLREQITGGIQPALMIIFGAAACMLFLAFANLANLMIAQSTTRQRELGIRAAIGAGQFRLGRQLMAESMVLAALAGIVSLLFASWTLHSLIAAIPPVLFVTYPTISAAAIDARIIAFDLALTLAGGLISGYAVASHMTGGSLSETLKQSGPGGRSHKLRAIFTTSEIALSVVLLVGTVVMVQSVQQLLRVDPGFKTDRLSSMHLSLPAASYPDSAAVARFYEGLRLRVAALPGVERAAVIDELPLTTDGGTMHVYVNGQPVPAPGQEHETVIRSASPDYFEALGIQPNSGRTFTTSDRAGAPNVVILSRTLAQQLFGARDPIGEQIVMPFDHTTWNIIGVVGDVHLAGLDQAVRPTIYTCNLQEPSNSSTLVVQSNRSLDSLLASVRAEVQRTDPELPVYAGRTIDETISMTPGVSSRRLVQYLVSAFGSIGILMATVGIYSLMNFIVSQRTREIGIRMALGASRSGVRVMVLRQAIGMAVIGLAAGLVIAAAARSLVRNVVFGVQPSDPQVLLVVSLVTVGLVLLAGIVPALRATRIDPLIALRQD